MAPTLYLHWTDEGGHVSVELRSLERDRFRQAAELLLDPALGLRAGDALHLAVALHSHCTQLSSFDRQMLTAAAALGMSPALD